MSYKSTTKGNKECKIVDQNEQGYIGWVYVGNQIIPMVWDMFGKAEKTTIASKSFDLDFTNNP